VGTSLGLFVYFLPLTGPGAPFAAPNDTSNQSQVCVPNSSVYRAEILACAETLLLIVHSRPSPVTLPLTGLTPAVFDVTLNSLPLKPRYTQNPTVIESPETVILC